jgi:hypothetical protein
MEEVHHAAQRGWLLFPCNGKKPSIKGWPEQATSEACQLEAWEKQFPGCNWGMATGPDCGVFVIDLDGDTGLDWLKAQIDAGNELPETWSTRTARGLHLYFAWPASLDIRNSASKLASGVDIRGAGGYVVIPPSVHPNGTRYAVVDDSCPVSPSPPWLVELLCEPAPAAARPRPVAPEFEIIAEGRRNDTLTRNGGYLRHNGLSKEEIETELLRANRRRCSPPLSDAEVVQIAASVARYPVGGPDPLQAAWSAIQGSGATSGYAGFMALAEALQKAREGMEVALPLKRIAKLFGVHFTSVQQWRKRAVAAGSLEPVGQYVAHRKAGTYRVPFPASKETKTLTTLTTGLVRDRESPIVIGYESSIVRAHRVPIVRVADSQDAATSFCFGRNAR